MWGLAVGAGLVAQAGLLQWTQPYPLLHTYLTLPVALFTFTLGFFFLAKSFLLTPLFFLPAIMIAKFTNVEEMLQQQMQTSPSSPLQIDRIKIPSTSGVMLDGVTLKMPSATSWIVFFNANGVPYEHHMDFLKLYAGSLPVNILTFNYRGVGASTGWPYQAQDLVDDGKAAVQYLIDAGVNPRNIILHGHSLGGGVATQVAHTYKDTRIIHDRTFRSMARAAQVILPQINGFMSFLFAAVVIAAVHTTLRFSVFAGQLPTWAFLVTGITMGLVVRNSNMLFPLVPWVMRTVGWDLDAVETFDVNRGMCIYHPRDEVLPFQLSDAYSVLSRRHQANLRTFELSAQHESMPCHMYPLNTQASEWEELLSVLQSFIEQS